MASRTAQILIGRPDPYHDGIYPTHVMYLAENSRPVWLLEPVGRGLAGATSDQPDDEEVPLWTTEPVVWVPSRPEHILEDGLLLLAVHVLRDQDRGRVGGVAPAEASADALQLAAAIAWRGDLGRRRPSPASTIASGTPPRARASRCCPLELAGV